jgi:anti-sigma factor ChrR (cupin superfamily)
MKPVCETPNFCKTARCPSSETLLRYRRRRLSIVEQMTIEKHLHVCDFCGAEIQLLNRHRLEAEEAEIVEMPSHLQKLAASLFSKTRELTRMGDLMVRSPLSH